MSPKVFVTRRIPVAGLQRLQADCDVSVWEGELTPPYEVLLERVKGMDGILCLLTDRVDAQLMEAAGPQLKVISQMAVGYDNIEIAEAKARGIRVGNTPGVLTDATADLTMALLLGAGRQLVAAAEYVKAGQWQTWEPMAFLGMDLHGATLGVIGLGRIGQAVARRAAGFDMQLLAHSPSCPPEVAKSLNIRLVDLDTLLHESDFVSLHVPLNERTRHLINGNTLEMMKSTSLLINTARGGIVDQQALYTALTDGIIGGAALDVTDPEPLSADHPLLSLPNVLILPHIGSASFKTRNLMARMAADNLLAGLRGDPLPNGVV